MLDGIITSGYDAAMKIKTTIQAACKRRGITTAYQLQKETGIYPAGAARLFNDRLSKVDLDNLSKLCERLSQLPANKPRQILVSELFAIVADDDDHKI